MTERRLRFLQHLVPERRRDTRLIDVREGWSQVPELPLAYQSRGNIITWRSVAAWRQNLNEFLARCSLSHPLREKYPHPLSRSEANREYHRLRYLSSRAAKEGMKAIAADILQNFDPKDTLIYVESGSMQLLYKMIADKLDGYGTMGWALAGPNEGPFMKNRGNFEGQRPNDAKTWLYIDDWILTGKRVGLLGEYPDKLFSYHLVTSDKGKFLFDKYNLKGKTIYKVIGDDGPENYFGQYPVYGFHKIPDVLSHVFADSAKDGSPLWTIFPRDGREIGRHSRLISY